MSEKRIIMGVDISTACTGVSIISLKNDKYKVIYVGHVKFKAPKGIKGTEALFFKSKQFAKEFVEKYKSIGFTDVVIEEPLPHSNNLNTVCTLLRFNGMLSQEIYQTIGIVPEYITSYDARKFAFPDLMAVRSFKMDGSEKKTNDVYNDIKNNKLVLFGNYDFKCDKKYILWNKISGMFPEIEWQYDKNGNLKIENFDASDSLVCALGYINKLKYENDAPKITSIDCNKMKTEEGIDVTELEYSFDFCGRNHSHKLII